MSGATERFPLEVTEPVRLAFDSWIDIGRNDPSGWIDAVNAGLVPAFRAAGWTIEPPAGPTDA